MELTQERLKGILNYNPETGEFSRFKKQGMTRCKTLGAGGYLLISIHGTKYRGHRLAWLYVHGEFPANNLDHIDGCRTNNAISNLRLATPSQNKQNRREPGRNNTSGFLGVHWASHISAWRAQIKVNKKSIMLGAFSTPEDAHSAYLKAKRERHPFCTI